MQACREIDAMRCSAIAHAIRRMRATLITDIPRRACLPEDPEELVFGNFVNNTLSRGRIFVLDHCTSRGRRAMQPRAIDCRGTPHGVSRRAAVIPGPTSVARPVITRAAQRWRAGARRGGSGRDAVVGNQSHALWKIISTNSSSVSWPPPMHMDIVMQNSSKSISPTIPYAHAQLRATRKRCALCRGAFPSIPFPSHHATRVIGVHQTDQLVELLGVELRCERAEAAEVLFHLCRCDLCVRLVRRPTMQHIRCNNKTMQHFSIATS